MAEVRETQVTKDTEGNVLDRRTIIQRPRRGGGFSLGLLIGVLIVAGAIIAFAYNQGSFQSAGARADRATQTAQAQLNQTSNAQQALNSANANPQPSPTTQQ